MRIRTQILLAYAYLVALLLAGALGAAVSFYQLGHELDSVFAFAGPSSRTKLENNFHRSVRDLMRDSAISGMKPSDSEDLKAFGQALLQAKKNFRDSRELQILEQMHQDFLRLQTFIQEQSSSEGASGNGPLELFPLVETLEKDLAELTTREDERVLEADSQLRQETRIRTMAFSLLVIIAILSLVLLSRELRRSLLSRLDELRELAHEIRKGHSHRRAFVASRDELGLLAEAINGLLDAWDEERHESQGRELRRRRVILALLAAFNRPAILLLPDKRVLASTVEYEEETIEALVDNPEELARQGWKIHQLQTPQGSSPGSLLLGTGEETPPR